MEPYPGCIGNLGIGYFCQVPVRGRENGSLSLSIAHTQPVALELGRGGAKLARAQD